MLDWRQGTYSNGTKVLQYPYCSAGYSPAEWRRGWVSPPPQCSGNVCSSTGTQYPVLINRATGRCLVRKSQDDEALPALSWDDAGPWDFWLKVT